MISSEKSSSKRFIIADNEKNRIKETRDKYENEKYQAEMLANKHWNKTNKQLIGWLIFSLFTIATIIYSFIQVFNTTSQSYEIDGLRIIVNSPFPFMFLIITTVMLIIELRIAYIVSGSIDYYEYKRTGKKRNVIYIGRNRYGKSFYTKKLLPIEKFTIFNTIISVIGMFGFIVFALCPPTDSSIVKNFANKENVKILSDYDQQYHLDFNNSLVNAKNGVYVLKERNNSFTREGELIPIADSVDVIVKSDEIDKLVEERVKKLEIENKNREKKIDLFKDSNEGKFK